ncbi:conserved hypothetical protein [Ricinus communis]|uniref:Uncharacterized protein n=1 Tax=Ricinus communis TaxID=3988 RepID=B9RPD8_RICCO|nr:conserved hypothetical protein [Ricinus communis]
MIVTPVDYTTLIGLHYDGDPAMFDYRFLQRMSRLVELLSFMPTVKSQMKIRKVDIDEQPLSDAKVDQYGFSFIAYLLGSTILADTEQCVHFRILPLLVELNTISSGSTIPFLAGGPILALRVDPYISWMLTVNSLTLSYRLRLALGTIEH